jgi:hypothetical protein
VRTLFFLSILAVSLTAQANPIASELDDQIAKLMAVAPGAPTLSLTQAMDLAIYGSNELGIQPNDGIAAIRERLDALKDFKQATRLGGMASPGLGYSHTLQTGTSIPEPIAKGLAPFINTMSYGYAVSLQAIVQGWFRGSALEHSGRADLNMRQAENLLALSVTQSYVQLVASLSHLKDYRAVLKAYVELDEKSDRANNRAFGDLIDSDLRALEAKINDLRSARNQAIQGLRGLLRTPVLNEKTEELLFSFPSADALALTIPDSPDELVRRVLTDSPQMDLLKEALASAADNRKADLWALFPDVSYSQRWANISSLSGGMSLREWMRNDAITVSYSMNPWAQAKRVQGDSKLQSAASHTLADQQTAIASSMRTSWQDAHGLETGFNIQKKNLSGTTKAYLCAVDYYQPFDPKSVREQLVHMTAALDGLYDAGLKWLDFKAEIRSTMGTLTEHSDHEAAVPGESENSHPDLKALCDSPGK